jgi:hypothetical protein
MIFVDSDNRGDKPLAFCRRDHFGLSALYHCRY